MMKKMMLFIISVMLIGCDYKVPLVKAPEVEIDKSVVGLWERTNAEGQVEHLLVLPLSGKEFLVSFPANKEDAMFAKACLCSAGGRTLVQFAWFGTAKGILPNDNRVFSYAAYSIAGEVLHVQTLNADVVNREADSSDALRKEIVKLKDSPDLFREEMVFNRVKD
jgi:hypothetical protein